MNEFNHKMNITNLPSFDYACANLRLKSALECWLISHSVMVPYNQSLSNGTI